MFHSEKNGEADFTIGKSVDRVSPTKVGDTAIDAESEIEYSGPVFCFAILRLVSDEVVNKLGCAFPGFTHIALADKTLKSSKRIWTQLQDNNSHTMLCFDLVCAIFSFEMVFAYFHNRSKNCVRETCQQGTQCKAHPKLIIHNSVSPLEVLRSTAQHSTYTFNT